MCLYVCSRCNYLLNFLTTSSHHFKPLLNIIAPNQAKHHHPRHAKHHHPQSSCKYTPPRGNHCKPIALLLPSSAHVTAPGTTNLRFRRTTHTAGTPSTSRHPLRLVWRLGPLGPPTDLQHPARFGRILQHFCSNFFNSPEITHFEIGNKNNHRG